MGENLVPRSWAVRLPLGRCHIAVYWSEEGRQRTELLDCLVAYLTRRHYRHVVDAGWSSWDLAVFCHPWTVLQLCTAQEDHGGGTRLIRLRCRMRACGCTHAVALLGAAAAAGALALPSWPLGAIAAGLLAFCGHTWWRGA